MTGNRLRVLSANLWNGAADARAFARLVEQLQADVVAMQELGPEQADEIARVLPHGTLEPARNCMGMGIALRTASPVRRVALPFRDAWVAEIRAGGTNRDAVEIMNVHVQAPHSPLTRTLGRRRGQLHGLQRYLEESAPRRLAMVGDFNATPMWPVYRVLAGRLRDAAVEVASRRGTRPRPTWGPWSGAPRLLRIDHAFVQGLAVKDLRVLPLAGSDHSAIVVDLSLDETIPCSPGVSASNHRSRE